MDKIVYEIEKIVRKYGNQILNVEREKIELEEKEGIGNFVTQYDKQIQENLKKELLSLLPDSNFIGEEEDLHSEILNEGYTFIVDPIDGTTNFFRGLSLSAISVALLKDGKSYIGVCYNPYIDEMFIAQKDKGAFLNNNKINVSNKKLKDGIVLTGNAPYYDNLREASIEILKKFSLVSTDFRRFGSAVVEICNVACGRAEVYFELKLQPWDFAAASLILEESGGKISQMNGDEICFHKPITILASNNKEDYFKYIN